MFLEDDLSNSNEAEVEEAEEREQLLSKRLCQREDSDHHIYKSKQIKILSKLLDSFLEFDLNTTLCTNNFVWVQDGYELLSQKWLYIKGV